jgi:pimeloyl-ACP methyl ester carboxylesterase
MISFHLPFITLQHSPLAGGPVRTHYRQFGSGRPLIFLHGGWGYEIYPLHEAEIPGVQVIIPDRSGYGRSSKPGIFTPDFHHLAAAETIAFLNALQIRQCVLWGHSDGAVIAAQIGLLDPQPDGLIFDGLILEALHYDRAKPRSRGFFEELAANPDGVGERAKAILARDHGEPEWRDAVCGDCQAWLEIARTTDSRPDLYGGRMSRIRVPVALIHGEDDPRTEPGELEQVQRELPSAQTHIIAGAGHSPHSARESRDECARVVREILAGW